MIGPYLGLKLLTNYSNRFNILDKVANLNNEILATSKKINDKHMSILAGECVQYILMGNYLEAENKLNEISDEKIDEIAKTVFKNRMDTNNFDKMLNWGEQINNITKVFLIYKSVKSELDNYNYNENFIENSINLIEYINSEIIDQVYSPQIIKTEAKKLMESLKSNLVYSSVKRLQGYLLALQSVTNMDFDFMNLIFDYDIKVFVSVIELFINSNLDSVATNEMIMEIVNTAVSNRHYDYSVYLKLAYYIDQLLKSSDNVLFMQFLQLLKVNLPHAVESISSSSSVKLKLPNVRKYISSNVKSGGKNADKIILSDSDSWWRFVSADDDKYYLKNVDTDMFVFSSKNVIDPYVHLLDDSYQKEFFKVKWHIDFIDEYRFFLRNSFNGKDLCKSDGDRFLIQSSARQCPFSIN